MESLIVIPTKVRIDKQIRIMQKAHWVSFCQTKEELFSAPQHHANIKRKCTNFIKTMDPESKIGEALMVRAITSRL